MSNFERFENDRYYFTDDMALKILGTRGSMSQLRHKGKGPVYSKLGPRVLYWGRDLNAYLDAKIIVVQPKND